MGIIPDQGCDEIVSTTFQTSTSIVHLQGRTIFRLGLAMIVNSRGCDVFSHPVLAVVAGRPKQRTGFVRPVSGLLYVPYDASITGILPIFFCQIFGAV